MAKKKQKKKNAGPPQPLVRLSQCMIVKNEEKNIARALSWARGIAFEQIVVDTGSTDRTIEIAERMGAKVLQFEWVDDFSAAKNFALEQAKGNWVAFLDADEYLTDEDAKHLLYCLKRIQEDPEMRNRWHALNFPWAHLDDNGKPFAIQDQERVFRSFVRYKGKIHERIEVPGDNLAHIDEITIYHTGYAESALGETKKAERNIYMLRKALEDKADDLDTKVYLADSLQAKGDPDSVAEAEMLFYEAVRGDMGGVTRALRRKAYMRLITKYSELPGKFEKHEDLCRKALLDFPGDIDFEFMLGEILSGKGGHREAWDALVVCESRLGDRDALTDSEIISANPALLYRLMSNVAGALGDAENQAKYEAKCEALPQ